MLGFEHNAAMLHPCASRMPSRFTYWLLSWIIPILRWEPGQTARAIVQLFTCGHHYISTYSSLYTHQNARVNLRILYINPAFLKRGLDLCVKTKCARFTRAFVPGKISSSCWHYLFFLATTHTQQRGHHSRWTITKRKKKIPRIQTRVLRRFKPRRDGTCPISKSARETPRFQNACVSISGVKAT